MKKMKKLISAVLTLALVLSVIAFVPAKEAKAASNYTFREDVMKVYYTGVQPRVLAYAQISGDRYYNMTRSDIKNIKVSDSNVKFSARESGRIILDMPAKKNSFTLSCTVAGQTIKCTIKTLPAGNPFKTFNIGTRKLASKFAKTNYVSTLQPITTSKGNTVIVMNTGWKIKSIYYYNTGSTSRTKTGLNASKYSPGKLAFNGEYTSYIELTVEQANAGLRRTVRFEYID